MTLFIGPVGDNGGPAIKNKILLKYLDLNSDFQILNTSDRSKNNLIKNIFNLLVSKNKQIIISVSRNGRLILFPLIRIKKFVNPNINYSIICIGGTIVSEARNHPRIIKKALQTADIVTVETRKIKQDLNDFGIQNVHYMPNYKEIVESNLNNRNEFNPLEVKFVFLSSIRNVKGLATMINSFNKVLEKYPLASLDIYGPIREDFDENIFENIKGNSQINYRGIVGNQDVVNTLAKYHIFIFPSESTTEGFPAVIIEAYLAGLAVVASDVSYNAEIVKDGINGWIFPSGNEEGLTQVLLKCFNNTVTLNRISENNKNNAKNFNAESLINEYRLSLKYREWKI